MRRGRLRPEAVPIDARTRLGHFFPVRSQTLWLLAGVGIATHPAVADAVVLPVVADTALFSDHPDNNYGGLDSLPIGGINLTGQEGRVLLRFDLAGAIPTNAVLNSVILQVMVVKEAPGGPPLTIEAFRMLTDWHEGTQNLSLQGDVAGPGESSWNAPIQGTSAWHNPGGGSGTDFSAAASGSATIGGVAAFNFQSSPALMADIRAWIADPASNLGWMLKARPPLVTGTARRLGARESGAGSRVTLGYTLPPPPSPPAFTSFQRVGDRVELRFTGQPGNLYEIQFQDPLGSAAWSPLTNFPVKFVPLDVVVSEPVDPAQRFYRLAITGQID